jgi:alpha-L-fucosidase
MTMAHSWYYSEAEEKSDSYKTPTELIHWLCDVVSKNGSLLLNIGPRPDGTIPDGMRQRLLAMGDWLRVNGKAIYGTRPRHVFGERSASRAKEKTKGRDGKKGTGQTPCSAGDIRFTTKGDTLYAILFGWPKGGAVKIKSLAEGKGPAKVHSVCLLGHEGQLTFTRDASGLTVKLPGKQPCKHAFALKIGHTE